MIIQSETSCEFQEISVNYARIGKDELKEFLEFLFINTRMKNNLPLLSYNNF